jgi:hypothetical protein
VSIDNRTLHTTGVVCDSITAYRSDFTSLHQTFVDCFALVSNWNELQHPTGLPWLQVFFRTFIMDKGGSTFGQEHFTSEAEKNLFCNLAAGFSYALGNLINAHTLVTTGTAFNDYVDGMDCWVRNPRPGNPDSCFKDEDEILGSSSGSIISKELLSWPFHEGSRLGMRMMPAFLQKLNTILRWSIFITTKGYIGIGPRLDIRICDRICILPGCRVPLVVRKVDDHYLLVGDAYVCGMMQGEVLGNLGNGEAELETMKFL